MRQINLISGDSRVILAAYRRQLILVKSQVNEARMHADRSIAESKALMIAADATMARLCRPEV
ncbi:MAG: hypothetical protein J2P54_15955 [Bradyrhizobiaceae bacterium]|nr:hypothetical protein [Bradyrhizobiaceae bacterium]